MPRKENGEDLGSTDGRLGAMLGAMLGEGPVSIENIGRSGRSFGGSIPRLGNSVSGVASFGDWIPRLGSSIPSAEAPNAVAANSAAGAGCGSSAILPPREAIGLFARALETNLATRSTPFDFAGP